MSLPNNKGCGQHPQPFAITTLNDIIIAHTNKKHYIIL